MSYSILILPSARKRWAKLPDADYHRVLAAIIGLASEPRPPGCIKLTGREAYRLRVGNFRIVYEVDDAARVVTILDIDDRKDVYK
jgi:mRNA interferase RelE/StbE